MTSLVSWSDFDRPRWDREGAAWPNRGWSRFVHASGLRWHVQEGGQGPTALLLHGTGASTHSWRDLGPRLAESFRVVAPDLPAHGFTDRPPTARMTLPGMSDLVRRLCEALEIQPDLVVGHSAGAAIAVRMIVDGGARPRLLANLNGAFFPYRGVATRVFSPVARLLSHSSAAPLLVAWRARDRASVERLIRSTGSTLDAEGVELYQRLVRKPGHVAGALSMMAGWDLSLLRDDLARLPVPTLFLVGDRDRAVAPAESRRAAQLAPRGELVELPGLGHLAHEEAPGLTADRIRAAYAAAAPARPPVSQCHDTAGDT